MIHNSTPQLWQLVRNFFGTRPFNQPLEWETAMASWEPYLTPKCFSNCETEPLCGKVASCADVFTNCIVVIPVTGSKSSTWCHVYPVDSLLEIPANLKASVKSLSRVPCIAIVTIFCFVPLIGKRSGLPVKSPSFNVNPHGSIQLNAFGAYR